MRVTDCLENLTSSCFICLKPFEIKYHKMRSCGSTMCEFTFEENALGNIFAELKNDWAVCETLIATAIYAFQSQDAANYTEPFPGFLLFEQEVRPKTGTLAHIREAREHH